MSQGERCGGGRRAPRAAQEVATSKAVVVDGTGRSATTAGEHGGSKLWLAVVRGHFTERLAEEFQEGF